MSVDPTDAMIVDILQHDGRASVREIAQAVDLPESTTRDRLRSLESRGLIRGYNAEVDLRKLGLDVVAWVFIDVSRGEADAFSPFILRQPAVLRGHAIANKPHSFALKVAAKDTHTLSRTIQSWRHAFDLTVKELLLIDDVAPRSAGLEARDAERLVLRAASEHVR